MLLSVVASRMVYWHNVAMKIYAGQWTRHFKDKKETSMVHSCCNVAQDVCSRVTIVPFWMNGFYSCIVQTDLSWCLLPSRSSRLQISLTLKRQPLLHVEIFSHIVWIVELVNYTSYLKEFFILFEWTSENYLKGIIDYKITWTNWRITSKTRITWSDLHINTKPSWFWMVHMN